MSQIYQPWRRTEAQWTADNPTIPAGVMALTYDPPSGTSHGLFKMGTGAIWSLTPYIGGSSYKPGIAVGGTTVLGAAAATVTITLPAGALGYKIEAKMRGSVAATIEQIRIRLNGDVGANYQMQSFHAYSAGLAALEAATPITYIGSSQLYLPASTAPADYYGHLIIEIPFPDMTTGWKDVLIRNGQAYGTGASELRLDQMWGIRRNTEALTSVSFYTASGNIIAGSTFKLTRLG